MTEKIEEPNFLVASGLAQGEVADILGVTILTAHKYFHGGEPKGFRMGRYVFLRDLVTRKLANGELPLPYSRYRGKVARAIEVAKIKDYVTYRTTG